MTENRAATIHLELEKLKLFCLEHDGDAVRIKLINYLEEIIKALPKTIE